MSAASTKSRSKNINRWYEKLIKNYDNEVLIFIFAFIVEIVFGLFMLVNYGGTFTSVDGVAHTYISRVAVDNGFYSGLASLTGVWLPLFHFLQIPFIIYDRLYTTGFSGTIISALMTGGICIYLYRLVGSCQHCGAGVCSSECVFHYKPSGGKVNRFAILAPVLFLTNIYTLIYGASPLAEQMAMFFLVVATYYFKSYFYTGSIKEFFKCSYALILGTLTRYEIWAVALFAVTIFCIREIRNRNTHRIWYAHLPLLGIAAWLLTEFIIHRDPLIFLNPFKKIRQFTPYFTGDIILVLKHLYAQIDMILGIFVYVILLSLITFILLRRAKELIPLSLLFVPLGLQILLMFNGSSLGWLRHFYIAMPGFVILTVDFIQLIAVNLHSFTEKIRDKLDFRVPSYWPINFHKTSLLIVAALFLIVIIAAYSKTPVIQSGPAGESLQDEKSLQGIKPWIIMGLDISNNRVNPGVMVENAENWYTDLDVRYGVADRSAYFKIKELIGSDKLLASYIDSNYISVYTGISPSQLIDSYDYLEYPEVMKEPWNHVEFVVIPDLSMIMLPDVNLPLHNQQYQGNFYVYNYFFNEEWRTEFLSHYDLVLDESEFKLFVKKKVGSTEIEEEYVKVVNSEIVEVVSEEIAADAKIELYSSVAIPSDVIIKEGQIVQWHNNDHRARLNVIASKPDESYWDSQELHLSDRLNIQFKKAGEYHYYNPLNPEMKGTIKVVSVGG